MSRKSSPLSVHKRAPRSIAQAAIAISMSRPRARRSERCICATTAWGILRHLMKTALMTCAVVILLLTATGAQAPVAVEKESHHKVRIDMLRLGAIELTLAPGETTAAHRHEFDVASIVVSAATTREQSVPVASSNPGDAPLDDPHIREAGSVTIAEYTGKPGWHRIANVGSAPARTVEVQNY